MASCLPHARLTPAPHRLRNGVLAATAAALLGALAPVLVAAGPAGASSLPARTSTESRIGSAVLALINAERAAHRLPALHASSQLMLSAREHDVAMARYDVLSHQLRGEAWLGTRVSRTGYAWSYLGENIGWNSAMSQAGVLALEQAMYGERPPNDGHRLNILSTHYRDVGVDVYLDSRHHRVWLTTDFGRRR